MKFKKILSIFMSVVLATVPAVLPVCAEETISAEATAEETTSAETTAEETTTAEAAAEDSFVAENAAEEAGAVPDFFRCLHRSACLS